MPHLSNLENNNKVVFYNVTTTLVFQNILTEIDCINNPDTPFDHPDPSGGKVRAYGDLKYRQ